ncbi:JmjC domain containing protein [Plasmodium gonderi]|uniref:JmjC domain containing protein n=1 Tax=Plasmodium gonderi TaxID=77519 RepID=A0A1Y1JM17_PLAGO|nr:JmjC domain containing protein [Plasmodium gonderi]GAW83499.1 JmjC domain containing protein [Plasmodium gonderi]
MDLHDKNIRKRKRNPMIVISSGNEDSVNFTEKNKKKKLIINDVDNNNLADEKNETFLKKEYDTRNRCALKTKTLYRGKDKLKKMIKPDFNEYNNKLQEEDKEQVGKSFLQNVETKLAGQKELIKINDMCNNNILLRKNKIEKLQNGELMKSENKDNNMINERKKKNIFFSDHNSNSSIYENIEEIPVIHTTMEELSNPILFFEKYNSIGLKYGAMKVKPPNFFEPQFNSHYINMKFNIRKQKINELKHGKEFDHPEEYWSLYEMYKYNKMLENTYLPKEKMSLENIEKKYWELISNDKEQVISIYGADLPVPKNHPTCLFHDSLKRLRDSGSDDCSTDISTTKCSKCETNESSCESKNCHPKNRERINVLLSKQEICEDPESINTSSSEDKLNYDKSVALPSENRNGDINSVNYNECNYNECNNKECNNKECNNKECNNKECNNKERNNKERNNKERNNKERNNKERNNKEHNSKERNNKERNNNEKSLIEEEHCIIDIINISDPENVTRGENGVDNRGHAVNRSAKDICYECDRKKDHIDHPRNIINEIECNGVIISRSAGGVCEMANNRNDRSKSTLIEEMKNCNNNHENHVGDLKKCEVFLKQREKYYSEINNVIKNINENLNIKYLPFIKGSMLRNVDIPIEGVNIPWLYVGTLFSSFCWHTEDNYFASINYQHWGKPKIWYVIPPLYSDKVEDVIYEYIKENNNQDDMVEKTNGKLKKNEQKSLINNADPKKKLKECFTPCIENAKRLKNMRIPKNNPQMTPMNGTTNITSFINNVVPSTSTTTTTVANYSRSNSSSYIGINTSSANRVVDTLSVLDVDINNVDLLYRKSHLNYKIVDKKQINFKKENNKNKIYKLTIQVPIEVFLKNNIPVYKNIQRKNEFIFLWPKTFHGGFNSGYNCNEACNIAPTFWLFYGLQSYYNYKYFRNTCISIHFILFSNLLHYQEYTFSQLKHIIYSLRYVLADEYKFFKESKTLFIDFTLNRDALLNNNLMNYSNHLSLDLNKMYSNFECQKNKHLLFQNIKSKLEFFYKDCDACNSPTFNSSIICPHSNDILCIHCSEEHSCNCKFKVTLKRYTLLEMMKILTLLTQYANKIKSSDEKEVRFDDIPDYNSLKIFEDKNSVKLYNLIRETKKSENEKRSKSTNYMDLENYCFEKVNNIVKEKNKKEKLKNEKGIVLEDYYISSNNFKTKLTLKYFLLTYEEEMEDNPLKILPKLIT